MKGSSPSSSGKLETGSNNINIPGRRSELVRRYKSNTYLKLQRFNIHNCLLKYIKIYEKILTSSLVRLGKRRKELTMKIFNWIWSKKQSEEVEVYEVRPHRMVDEMVREFNADHGLPLDQLVG